VFDLIAKLTFSNMLGTTKFMTLGSANLDHGAKMVKITYLRNWTHNMGNVFIDLGSIQSLKMAAPQSKIFHVSGTPIRLFDRHRYTWRRKLVSELADGTIGRLMSHEKWNQVKEPFTLKPHANLLDLGSYIKTDYAVLSGCVFYRYPISRYKETLLKLKKKNVKIIFNGVGGATYSEPELAIVKKFLTEIKPYALVSRDNVAFEKYHKFAEHSHNGIDCAFFVNDFFQPAEFDAPDYVVLTFDKHPEPNPNLNSKLIIRAHHEPYDAPKEYFEKPNTLISDSADDYFNIYANAKSVYTDRVHACVVALSFGTPCRLYNSSVRSLLFERVGLEEINKKLVYADARMIRKEKEKQIAFLREILTP